MRKDQQEHLRRLEQALLEADAQDAEDTWEVTEEESDTWLEDAFWENEEIPDNAVNNTDDADVDMERYSEAVSRASRRSGCSIGVFLVLLAVLSCAALWFLKKWGIL